MRRLPTVLAVAAALLAAAPAAALAVPPQVTISDGPPPITNNRAPSFRFASDDPTAILTCQLDGPTPSAEQPCPMGQAGFIALGDGDYVFTVRATNVATEVGQATRAFTVDTAAPAAPVIAAPVEGATVPGPDVPVSGTAETGAAVDVLDGATVVAHATVSDGTWSATAQLADGAHTLTAVATDAAGNPSPASDARDVTVDSIPPDTTIESGPSGLTRRASAAFVLRSPDAGATFQCRLTGPGHQADSFGACGDYPGLADGGYTFAARAVDAAGNVDGSPASREFTVDTTPPAAPALSGTAAAFAFASEPGATFACALDGPFQPCTSPLTLSGLAPGSYTLRVHAIDAAGNLGSDAAVQFTIAAQLPSPPAPVPLAPVPVFHTAVVARPGLADVRVRLPGSTRYTRLTADRALPLGTVFDTRRGSVQLVSVPRRGATPQRASFDGGVFRVTQPGATTVLTLVGSCRPARRLTGDGRGAFQVRGRYSSATVRSARWVVRDSCAATLTRALEGVVQVRDHVRRRNVLVRAGRRYLARPKT